MIRNFRPSKLEEVFGQDQIILGKWNEKFPMMPFSIWENGSTWNMKRGNKMKYRRNKPIYFSDDELEMIVKGLAKLNSEMNKTISEIKSAKDIHPQMFFEKHNCETVFEKVTNELEQRNKE